MKGYTIVYIYAWWCASCRTKTPLLIEWEKDKQNVNLILINTDKEKDYHQTYAYLNELNYFYPSFTVSDYYGKGRESKYNRFFSLLCNTCEIKKMGYSSIIVFDESDTMIYYSTYETEDQLAELDKILSK